MASSAPAAPAGLIYLDTNATTPLEPAVCAAMLESFELFGNPSSSHALGRAAKARYEVAREQVARLVGAASASSIVFVSCGTESINYALRGAALAARREGRGNHIVTSAVEHVAVLETCRFLSREHGFAVTFLAPNSKGRVETATLEAALTPATCLVSIMHANNEVGTVNDIAALCSAAKAVRPEVLFHTDASQSLGKVPVDVTTMGVDYVTVAGHKLYAPKGVGALWVRPGTPPLDKLMYGAGHEDGRRAGTESTVLAVGLGAACEVARERLDANAVHMQALRDRLQDALRARFPDTSDMRINGDEDSRLPNTLSVSFRGILAPKLLARIEHRVAASAGSACHANQPGEPVHVSHVLTAMGLPLDFATGTLRLSVGRHTTAVEVDEAAQLIADAATLLLVSPP